VRRETRVSLGTAALQPSDRLTRPASLVLLGFLIRLSLRTQNSELLRPPHLSRFSRKSRFLALVARSLHK
jgi:hypothetical protein